MAPYYQRNESLDQFAARKKEWDAETGPRPIPKVIILGGLALTVALGIGGSRRFLSEPDPNQYTNSAPPSIDTDADPTLCTFDTYTLPVGGTKWEIAGNYPLENSNDILDRMQDVTADEAGRTMPYAGDTIRVYSDDDCVPEK